jgi:hypothetical protein
MSAPAIARRIDHLLVRTDDPAAVQRTLGERLGLPPAWLMQQYGGFASAGVFAGNVHLELIRFGPPTGRRSAGLYGIALEPVASLDETVRRLQRAGIPHGPPTPVIDSRPGHPPAHLWTNLLLTGPLGSTPAARLYSLAARVPGVVDLGSRTATGDAGARRMQRVLDVLFPSGLVFFVTYAPGFAGPPAQREADAAALRAGGGGPLGLIGVDRVVTGLRSWTRDRRHWARLAGNGRPGGHGAEVSTFEDGPAIEVIPAPATAPRGLVLRVRSLEQAEQHLTARGLRGTRHRPRYDLDRTELHGLRLTLIEG